MNILTPFILVGLGVILPLIARKSNGHLPKTPER